MPVPVRVVGGSGGISANRTDIAAARRRATPRPGTSWPRRGATSAAWSTRRWPPVSCAVTSSPARRSAPRSRSPTCRRSPRPRPATCGRPGCCAPRSPGRCRRPRPATPSSSTCSTTAVSSAWSPACCTAWPPARRRCSRPTTSAARPSSRPPTIPRSRSALVGALGLGPAVEALADPAHDGHGVAHDTGIDTWPLAAAPPRRLSDIVADLARATTTPATARSTCASCTMPDGTRRAIVDITGTKSWDPHPTRDVTDLTTNVRALAGRRSAYEHGVLAAMRRAGVGRDDDVMLVGHSQGGMVAVNTARDAGPSGRFRVTHVITAGAPVGRAGRVRARPGRRCWRWRTGTTSCRHLDDRANPDRGNVTTATVDLGDGTVGGDHGLDETYLPAGDQVPASRAPLGPRLPGRRPRLLRRPHRHHAHLPDRTAVAGDERRTRRCRGVGPGALLPRARRWATIADMLGLMQDYPLTTNWIFARAGQYYARQGDRHPHRHRHRAHAPSPTCSPRRAGSPATSTRSGSPPTGGWARSAGTPRGTWRCTSPSRAPGGSMHTINIRYFAEQLDLHDRPRRGRGDLRRPLAAAAAGQVPARTDEREARRRHGRRRRLRAARRPAPGRLRRGGRLGHRGRLRRPGHGRAPGRGDLLHHRHHRQPEGRPLLPPLDLAALERHRQHRRLRAARRRPRPAGRADVPRQRLGAALRLPAGRRVHGHARPGPVADRRSCDLLEDEKVTVTAGVPTIWMGCCRCSTAATCRRCG